MKYVYSIDIGIFWLVCMIFGTKEVWQNGWGDVVLMWFMVSFLCALLLGTVLTMFDFLQTMFDFVGAVTKKL